MAEKNNQVANKISEASQKVEQTAVRVARGRATRAELTGSVTDSAAVLSAYLVTRARKSA